MKIKSSHTQGQLRIGCGELIWLSGDQSRQFFACVRELTSNYCSRRDVILDLEPIVLISLEAIEDLLQLKAVLASENRSLAVINLRPLVAEMLRNISASDLLAAGRAVSEEPSFARRKTRHNGEPPVADVSIGGSMHRISPSRL